MPAPLAPRAWPRPPLLAHALRIRSRAGPYSDRIRLSREGQWSCIHKRNFSPNRVWTGYWYLGSGTGYSLLPRHNCRGRRSKPVATATTSQRFWIHFELSAALCFFSSNKRRTLPIQPASDTRNTYRNAHDAALGTFTLRGKVQCCLSSG